MNKSPSPETLRYSLPPSFFDRWEIYHRLRSLGIRCHCAMYSPLTVEIDSPRDLVQLIGVLRYRDCSRGEAIEVLEACWRLEAHDVDR